MDLGRIEAFLALSEELHFGKAAQRLFVSQPMMSRRIASLERQIGELSDADSPPQPAAEVRPLRTVRGPNPAGG